MTTNSYSLRLTTKSATTNASFAEIVFASVATIFNSFATISSFAKRHNLALLFTHPYEWAMQTTVITTLAELYSGLLEEKVSPRFTLYFVIAQVAAFFTIMPAGMSLLCRLACFGWLLASTVRCMRAYGE